MKFEQALPAMRVGYVIGVHYPVNGVTTWYSKCPIHPHDVYVHGFSRVKDMIGQFPSSDVMRDDWIVGMHSMVRTNIHLDERQRAWLLRQYRVTGVRPAEQVRRLIDAAMVRLAMKEKARK